MQELLDPMGRTGEPYRALTADGLNVRLGLELHTSVVRKVPEGALFHVFARQVNAQGIERLRTIDGWTSLRGASDGKLVAEPVVSFSPEESEDDVVERCMVESKLAFRSARSCTSRSVRFAEQIAETRELHIEEKPHEDDVSVNALIDSVEHWLFDSSTLNPNTDKIGFLPEFVQGNCVLVEIGIVGNYLVDNSQLQAAAPRLGYRRSMRMEDRSSTPGPVWGSVVQGILRDGWLQADMSQAVVCGGDADAMDRRAAGDALLHASAHGLCGLVTTLLASRADHGVRDASGRTPLMQASLAGHLDVVEALLSAGADHTLEDNDGCTAAMLASSSAAPKEFQSVGLPSPRRKLGGA